MCKIYLQKHSKQIQIRIKLIVFYSEMFVSCSKEKSSILSLGLIRVRVDPGACPLGEGRGHWTGHQSIRGTEKERAHHHRRG